MRDWKFLQNLLQSEPRIRKEAGWAVLDAVKELFPEKFAELKKLTARLEAAPYDDEDADEARRIYEEVEAEVQRWIVKNRIACPAVHEAALRFVCGEYGPDLGVVVSYADDQGEHHWLPSITAVPRDETKQRFLERADAHYDHVVRLLEGSAKPRAVKRDLDHFRCLVAQCVGKYSPAQISRGEVPGLTLSRNLSAITIAGEVRKLADFLGISRSHTPGVARGSKHQRKRKRPRRA